MIVLWRSRPVVHPVAQIKPMMKMILAGRMESSVGAVWIVHAGYIGQEDPKREIPGDLDWPTQIKIRRRVRP